jgi:hypothetical protein
MKPSLEQAIARLAFSFKERQFILESWSFIKLISVNYNYLVFVVLYFELFPKDTS